ncbi:MAG: hypothetical protein EA397_00165 [Deltaproteobacteria bacterium]|nr:MAG: hypothetical protein EA397_00165 [Deltaproteobacteria bacterium]
MWRWFCVSWLVACSIEAPDEELPFFDPSEPGPYAPGVTTLDVEDPRGGTLRVEVWYPARVSDSLIPSPYPELPLTLGAYRDVPVDPDGLPAPLLAFSHGLGGIRFQSAHLCEYLASHGYVVVAPDHPGTILISVDWDHMGDSVARRPGDVRLAVDAVLERAADPTDRLAGAVDDERYVMLGHSFGAVTTLMLGGATIDRSGVATWCEGRSGIGCRVLSAVQETDEAAYDLVDPRVDAIVPLSVGGWYAFGPGGENLAALPPSLVLAGERDGVLDYEVEQRPTWHAMAEPSDLLRFPEAGHYAAFSDICRILPFHGDCDEDLGLLDAEIGQALTARVITAWLRSRVEGDDRYEDHLRQQELSPHAYLERR